MRKGEGKGQTTLLDKEERGPLSRLKKKVSSLEGAVSCRVWESPKASSSTDRERAQRVHTK